MKILALIPARGGSKRVPGKNIRPLGGKPLIEHSIDVVKDMPDVRSILVSTDDPSIAEAARRAGASVPWLRPAELAGDMASSVDVALHALAWYEGEEGPVDGLLLLQPTSPFRSRETVERGIALFRERDGESVIGVSPAASHPMWCFRIEGLEMKPFVENGGIDFRSQDLPPAYTVNGAFYLIAPAELRKHKSFYTKHMVPLIVDRPEEAVDIDTEWDWRHAEAMLPKA